MQELAEARREYHRRKRAERCITISDWSETALYQMTCLSISEAVALKNTLPAAAIKYLVLKHSRYLQEDSNLQSVIDFQLSEVEIDYFLPIVKRKEILSDSDMHTLYARAETTY